MEHRKYKVKGWLRMMVLELVVSYGILTPLLQSYKQKRKYSACVPWNYDINLAGKVRARMQ